MHIKFPRSYGRSDNQLRPLSVTYGFFPHAAGSALLSVGNTIVACGVMLGQGVPQFLKGKKCGWLTAEYALLPASTPTRSQRENITQRNGRNIEISRLLGRALRTIVKLHLLPEQTITIDCDVISADGSTRVAAISAACLALKQAELVWLEAGIIKEPIITEEITALSLGLRHGEILVDLDCREDNTVDADFNIILTRSQKLVEIQGGAEKKAIAWRDFDKICALSRETAEQLFAFYDANKPPLPE